jgi:hypothetical protein
MACTHIVPSFDKFIQKDVVVVELWVLLRQRQHPLSHIWKTMQMEKKLQTSLFVVTHALPHSFHHDAMAAIAAAKPLPNHHVSHEKVTYSGCLYPLS